MRQGFFGKTELSMVSATPSLTPKCGSCGLHKTCKSPKMPPSGKGLKQVLIVAEAPGQEEDDRGVQLVGNSGKMLMRALDKAGFDMRKDGWLTSALICRPPKNIIKNKKAIDYCRPNLLKTLKELEPKVVILLGGTAIESLMPHIWKPSDLGGMARWTGWQIPSQKLNAWVCPTYHPAYLLRMNDKLLDSMFERHLKAAVGLAQKERPWPENFEGFNKEVNIYQDPSWASVALRNELAEPCNFAFDYETNMLKPESKEAEIVSCSVHANGTTLAFPWMGEPVKLMKTYLADKRYGKIASNLKFEERWTRAKLGIRVRNWKWDTMLAAHALDSRRAITSIKFQSFVTLGQPDYAHRVEGALKAKGGNKQNNIRSLDWNTLLLYNGLDSLLEYKVAEIQAAKMGITL